MPIGSTNVYNSGDLILNTVSGSGTSFIETKIIAATSSLIYFDNNARINSASLNNVSVGSASYVNPLTQSVLLKGSLKFDPSFDPNLSGNEVSSSYLFVSASNTQLGYDLYVRQNGNLTKWKWIEGQINTGLLYGGVLSYSGSTIYVSKGAGIVVSPNATTSSEAGPSLNYVTWNDYTSSIASRITSSQATYVYIGSDGSINLQDDTFFSVSQYASNIPIGMYNHTGRNSITSVANNVYTTYNTTNQSFDFIQAFGPLKIDGLTLTGQSGTLRINVGAGTSYILGGFYQQDPNNISHKDTNAYNTASIARVYRSGSGTFYTDNNAGSFYTVIDPTKYDDGTGVLATVGNNWSIQRVFFNPFTGRTHVYYGQEVYDKLATAISNLPADDFTEAIYTSHQYVLVAYLILYGTTTDLTNTTENSIVQAGLFRNTVGSSGGTTFTLKLTDLADVAISSPTTSDLLVYNGSKWANTKVLGGITSSVFGTSSWANNSVTASYLLGTSTVVSSSYALTSSYSSFAQTASSISSTSNAYVFGGNSFGGNATLGLNDNYRLDLEVGGSTVMSLTGSSVGIGTTSPAARLHVSDGNILLDNTRYISAYDTNGTARTVLYGRWSDNATYLDGGIGGLYIRTNNSNTTAAYISASGYIGIGTTSPTAILDIRPDASWLQSEAVIIDTDGSNNPRIKLYRPDGVLATTAYPIHIRSDSGNLNILNSNTAAAIGSETVTSRMYITRTGLIGIGTTSPSYQLDVYKTSNDAVIRSRTTGAGAYVYLDSATDGWYGINMLSGSTSRWFVGSYGTTDFTITRGIGSSEYVRVNTTGTVLIGTTSTSSGGRLIVRGDKVSASYPYNISIQSNNTGSGEGGGIGFTGLNGGGFESIQGAIQAVFETAGTLNTDYKSAIRLMYRPESTSALTEGFRLNSSGNVGIGTTSPAYKLEVVASSTSDGFRIQRSGISQFVLTGDGVMYWGSGANYGYLTWDTDVAIVGGYSSKSLALHTNATEKARIDTNGNVGIGTSSPNFKLDNYNTTLRSLNYVAEKIIEVAFTNGVANQKVDISFAFSTSNVFWGYLEVDLTSDFSNQNSVGKLTKVFSIGLSGASGSGPYTTTQYDNTSYYTDAYGVVADNWAITGFNFNTTTGQHYFTIVHRTSTSNTARIKIKGFGVNVIYTNNIAGITAGSVYTTDTTTYYKPVVETLQSRIGYNGNINQSADLIVQGSVGIGTTSPAAKLEVSGSNSNAILNVKSPSTSNILYVSGSGKVGVNTSTPLYTLQVNGSFGATTKSFIIDHPTKEGKKLVYGSLESPYHGIRLTGRSTLINGECKVELPDYICKLARVESVNIQITGIKCPKTLYVEEINIVENYFIVNYEKRLLESYKDYDFFWDFTAIRADVPELETEI